MRIILELDSNHFVGADAEDLADRALFPEQTRHAVEAVRQAFDGAVYRVRTGDGKSAPRLFYPKIGDSLAPPTYMDTSEFIERAQEQMKPGAFRGAVLSSYWIDEEAARKVIAERDRRFAEKEAVTRARSEADDRLRKSLQEDEYRQMRERAELDRINYQASADARRRDGKMQWLRDYRDARDAIKAKETETTMNTNEENIPTTTFRGGQTLGGDITFSTASSDAINEAFQFDAQALIFHFCAPTPEEAGTIRLTVAPHAQRDATLAALNGELTKQEYINVAAVLGIDHGVALFLSDWMPDVEQAHDEAEGGSR